MLSGEATHTNFIVFGLTIRSTELEARTLTIMPPMCFNENSNACILVIFITYKLSSTQPNKKQKYNNTIQKTKKQKTKNKKTKKRAVANYFSSIRKKLHY